MIRMLKDERSYWAARQEKYVWNYSYALEHEINAVRDVLNREIIKLREIRKEVDLVEIRFEELTSKAFLLIEKEHLQEFEKKYLKEKE